MVVYGSLVLSFRNFIILGVLLRSNTWLLSVSQWRGCFRRSSRNCSLMVVSYILTLLPYLSVALALKPRKYAIPEHLKTLFGRYVGAPSKYTSNKTKKSCVSQIMLRSNFADCLSWKTHRNNLPVGISEIAVGNMLTHVARENQTVSALTYTPMGWDAYFKRISWVPGTLTTKVITGFIPRPQKTGEKKTNRCHST